jgi:glutathione S-transferase
MKLYYSQNSPFSRIARIAVRELGMVSFVEELLAANREPDNPVLVFSPVGRVPTLLDRKLVITETKNVVQYLALQSNVENEVVMTSDWDELMQEGQILGFVDGVGCWVRENRRDPGFVSPFLIDVEFERSKRCLSYLENEAQENRLGAFPQFRFMVLAAGLDLMNFHQFHSGWQEEHPALADWFEMLKSRPSMLETAPV